MRHVDLFSGIGGFALAARWAGIKTIAFCEIDPYCQALLKLRFPGIPIYNDIRNLTYERIASDAEKRENSIGKCGVVAEAQEGWQGCDTDFGVGNQYASNAKLHGSFAADGSDGAPEPQKPSGENEVRQLAGGGRLQVDLLTGGFPCQPFSCAGRRRGAEDDRYLWPEMLRVISEIRPRWIIGENVGGLINMVQPGDAPDMEAEAGAEDGCNEPVRTDGILFGIIDGLEKLGYAVQAFVIPACALGAWHRRDRIWIVGNLQGERHSKDEKIWSGAAADTIGDSQADQHGIAENPVGGGMRGRCYGDTGGMLGALQVERPDRHASDAQVPRLEGRDSKGRGCSGGCDSEYALPCSAIWKRTWIEVATELCSVDDGLPVELGEFKCTKSKHREFQLKGYGNAVVPQIPYLIMRAIKNIEEGKK